MDDKTPTAVNILDLATATFRENLLTVQLKQDKNVLKFRK